MLCGMLLNSITTMRHLLYWPRRTLSWTKSHVNLYQYPQPISMNGSSYVGPRMTQSCQPRPEPFLACFSELLHRP